MFLPLLQVFKFHLGLVLVMQWMKKDTQLIVIFMMKMKNPIGMELKMAEDYNSNTLKNDSTIFTIELGIFLSQFQKIFYKL